MAGCAGGHVQRCDRSVTSVMTSYSERSGSGREAVGRQAGTGRRSSQQGADSSAQSIQEGKKGEHFMKVRGKH